MIRTVRLLAAGALLLVAACTSSDDGTSSDPSADGGDATASELPVTALTFNVLHGLFCPAETDACQAPDRVAMLAELVEEADCPDLVGLQEVGPRVEELLADAVPTLCDGGYTVAWAALDSPDRSMVLTRLPIADQGLLDIANFPWEAYWVRVESPQGPVDFLTAHFASSSNDPPCTPDGCPPVCATGISTNECHAHEVVDLFAQRSGARLTIAAGDLNAEPDSPTVAALTDAGFVDAWLAAGNDECDPATEAGCTGGDGPEPFVGMDTPEGPAYDERIDYVLARPADDCDLRTTAEPFAASPRPEPRNGLWWPSDHAGVLATLSCA